MTTKRFSNLPTLDKIQKYFELGGAGVEGAHVVLTNAEPFEGDDNHYVYALKPYTDETTFTTLEEGGEDVGATRRTCATVGYPSGDTITGKFTKVVPASGKVVAAYVINLNREE